MILENINEFEKLFDKVNDLYSKSKSKELGEIKDYIASLIVNHYKEYFVGRFIAYTSANEIEYMKIEYIQMPKDLFNNKMYLHGVKLKYNKENDMFLRMSHDEIIYLDISKLHSVSLISEDTFDKKFKQAEFDIRVKTIKYATDD
jgi:hypothetical protein